MALDVLCDRLLSLGLLPEGGGRQMDLRTMGMLTVALLLATAPLELSQLVFALIGAAAYALLQALQLAPGR
eukprot:CAMPEP_0168454928 /NCGR_PEP_ID=MMETSP0228-20121227/50477_1 /TAXON_ID=133427 /ORGANISM="Protoceratium reticulatum, Strain CCCM 535 (=CCMP 1889)" /LENGTH=70 /DNA_ID=CAMNT_0008469737 /DNA_START=130 /DNA_END=338 /DNA_ORIENTATION=+